MKHCRCDCSKIALLAAYDFYWIRRGGVSAFCYVSSRPQFDKKILNLAKNLIIVLDIVPVRFILLQRETMPFEEKIFNLILLCFTPGLLFGLSPNDLTADICALRQAETY